MSAEQISPELVERMCKTFRELAKQNAGDIGQFFAKNWIGAARAIVAELPAPVDPDLIEARELTASLYRVGTEMHGSIHEGRYDRSETVKVCLLALKRGRQLEREGK